MQHKPAVTVKPGKKSLSLDYSCSLHSCPAADSDPGTFDTPSSNRLLWLADSAWPGSSSVPFVTFCTQRLGGRTASPAMSDQIVFRCILIRRFNLLLLYKYYRERLQAKQIKHHPPDWSTTWQHVGRSNRCWHDKKRLFILGNPHCLPWILKTLWPIPTKIIC